MINRDLVERVAFVILFSAIFLSSCGGGSSSSQQTLQADDGATVVFPETGTGASVIDVEISSIRYDQDLGTVVVLGMHSHGDSIAQVEVQVIAQESDQYWNGESFQNQPFTNLAVIDSETDQWKLVFSPIYEQSFIVKATALTVAGGSGPVSSREFDLDLALLDDESQKERFEQVPIAIEVERTRQQYEVTYTADYLNGTQPPPKIFDKVIRNQIEDLWDLGQTLRVAIRFHDGGLNPNGVRVDYSNRLYSRGFFQDDREDFSSLACSPFELITQCEQRVKAQILAWANEWSRFGSINFVLTDSWHSADIRVGIDDECYANKRDNALYGNCGSWAYLGKTFTRGVSPEKPTMNFDWVTKSVVLHEFGHALGFAHEQSSPLRNIVWNEQVAVDYFSKRNQWTESYTRQQISYVLTDPYTVTVGEYDQNSIMHYSVRRFDDLGQPLILNMDEACNSNGTRLCIEGGIDLSNNDKRGMSLIYPSLEQVYNLIASGEAYYLRYTPNLNNEANRALFDLVPEEVKMEAYNHRGIVENSIVIRSKVTNYDCNSRNNLLGDRRDHYETWNLSAVTKLLSPSGQLTIESIPFSYTTYERAKCGRFASLQGIGDVSSYLLAALNR